ncbi:MAG: hypothetical protein K8S55_05960 [Phycisphaerae bacterium]|nr:hypothetical protein [Phycisphaerae bacterium]
MSIDFGPERWKKLKETYRLFWAGELDRPIIPVVMGGRAPGRTEPKLPDQPFAAFYDLSVSAEDIIDRWDYNLSCCEYLGDAYPSVWPNFGPGVMAAFMGAKLETGNDTVWFHPTEELPIRDIHFEYDPDNVWLNRIRDIYIAGIKRWGGQVLMGMTDLGGNLDVLATFRPSEKLLLDLYDEPDEVKRLTWEAHDLWHRFFGELNEILQPVNPGYSAWAGIYSEQPYYMQQCDFNYMLGPDMFDEFVKPELEATCRKLTNAFYHLDGPGQLASLDSLLTIEKLDGVQWIPGEGSKTYDKWPDVYQKIHAAGKRMQVAVGDMDILDTVIQQIGTSRGVQSYATSISKKDEATCRQRLAGYGIE